MQETVPSFPPVEIATKLLLSLGIGLLVGFERQWARKDLGVRTFTIISLFGMLAALIAPPFIFIGLAGVIALLAVVNIGTLWTKRPLEPTTSGALLVTFARSSGWPRLRPL
jgi:MgtC family